MAILTIAAADAQALDYASNATLDSSYYGKVNNLADSANGTSETDDKQAVFKNDGGTVSLMFVTYDFPTHSVSKGSNTAYLIVDKDVKGTVTARVTAINGTAITTGTTVTISGTSLSDAMFGLDYTLDSSVDITSVSFLVVLADAKKQAEVRIDAVALPEPGTWLLFGLGAVGLGAWSRRRRKRRA